MPSTANTIVPFVNGKRCLRWPHVKQILHDKEAEVRAVDHQVVSAIYANQKRLRVPAI